MSAEDVVLVLLIGWEICTLELHLTNVAVNYVAFIVHLVRNLGKTEVLKYIFLNPGYRKFKLS